MALRIVVVTNQSPGSRRAANPVVSNQVRFLSKYVDVYRVITPEGRFKLAAYLKLIRELLKVRRDVRSHDIDVVHIQFGGLLAFISTTIIRARCFVSFHGTDLHGGSFETWTSQVKAKINQQLSVIASRKAAAVSVVSRNLLQYLPQNVRARAVVIGTGADIAKFRKMPKEEAKGRIGLSKEKRYILFSDLNNSYVKRKDIAQAVVATLEKDFGEIYELLILSGVEHDLMPDFLNSCEVLLLTSDQEGSPNIVKEAIACDLPIVSLDVGDVKEYSTIFDKLLVVDRDVRSLAKAVIEAQSDNRQTVARSKLESISLDAVARRTVRVYESCIT